MGAASSTVRRLHPQGEDDSDGIQVVATLAVTGEELPPVYVKPKQTVGALKEALLHVGAAGDALGGVLAFRLLKGPVLLKDSESMQAAGLVNDPTVQVVRSFSPPIVTASCDRTAKLWLADTGDCVRTFEPHRNEVRCARFSPDGRLLVTASNNANCTEGQLKHWDVATSKCLLSRKVHTDMLRSVAFSHDGRWLVTASDDHTARTWETDTNRPLLTLAGHSREVWAAEFSVCGRFVVTASADGTCKVWGMENGGHCLTTFGANGHQQIRAATISKSTEVVATGAADSMVKVWPLTTQQLSQQAVARPRTLSGHSGEVWAVAFSDDERWLVSAGIDTKVVVWELEFGVMVRTLTGHFAPIVSVAFAMSDALFVTASTDGTARVWNLEAGTCLQTLCGHAKPLWSAQFLRPPVVLGPL
mmetsp:Transcript_49693/g.118392  ORF Transcript_49693/g.118392 Transcript_49693/m.118392 type:complete len:417 (-) Transcript_49693:128-1378(-)